MTRPGKGLSAALTVCAVALLAANCGQDAEEFSFVKDGRRTALTQDEVCIDGDPACTPTGAHAKHGAYACSVCHKVAGRLAFDRTGPAYGTGIPAPSFDAAAKTCTNVACHSVAPGTYSYYFPGGDGEPVLNVVSYGGGPPRPTPSWYATGVSCTACHDDPPRNGSTGSNSWHSGNHGSQGPTGARNQCQLCHPDATSPGNGIGDTITNPALHANGVATVQGRFTSQCFGCH
jgi:predicted CxxxxCH...CXXCH cytochrome family protein